ncbi:T9SS type B sorting domain-containing protein [Filimonas zeae]|uniref:T9SS type B sorting domain-containing protein n=1 Tax=Filimonas zeae TaxID=1737353 RepID=UPI00286CAC3F|nr:gliding motility-associated C-terminal domain-containing protein [Filimonas zeae]
MAFLLCTLLGGIAHNLWAQVDYSIGKAEGYNPARGTFLAPYPCPLQDFAEGHRAQYLYLASELTALGMRSGEINAIRFRVFSTNSAGVTENMVVKLGGTVNTALQYDKWENVTGAVTNAIGNYQAVTGINTLNLATPFIWNGTDNIVVEICNGDVASSATTVTTNTVNPSVYYSANYDFIGSHTFYGNNLPGGTACGIKDTADRGIGNLRPDITFSWSPAVVCTGGFTPAAAVSSVSSVCGAETVSLSWTGEPAKGMTYQWQSSSDNAVWADIAAASSFLYTTTQPATTWYRLKITCINGGSTTQYSSSVKVNTPDLLQGTFTIDNAVAASDPAAKIFKTFTDAFGYIKCGIKGPVVFNVVNNPTPYTEQLVIPAISGTSAVNTVTVNGNNAVITAVSSNDVQRAVIKLDGADHIILNNLVVKAAGNTASQYGYGIHLLNNADSNTVKGCTITVDAVLTSSNYAGIVVNGGHSFVSGSANGFCDDNLFEANTIEGGYYGIAVIGIAATPVKRNKFINNSIKNFYYYGIYVYGGTLQTEIEGNDLSRPGRPASSTSVYGIAVEQANMAAKVSGNRIHNFFDQEASTINDFYGISFSNADADAGVEHVVSNNLIYNIISNGTIYGIRNFGSNFVNYYHNTISITDAGSVSAEPAYGLFLDFAASALEVKNNIFAMARGGAGMKYSIYFDEQTIAMYTFDYNDYFLADHPTTLMGYFDGKEIATLAAWRTATAQDEHSFNEDPGFTDAAAGNFTPTSAIVNDKGTAVPVLKDIVAANRSTTKPDVGAYEFALPACGTNFRPGEAFSSVGVITCPDKSMLLNLKSNDVGLGLTYQWESASALTGTWSSVSTALQYPAYTVKTSNTNMYYRAAVSCNGGTPLYSVPVQVTVGGVFQAGTYTIDKTKPSDPAGTKNFNSFGEAVAALSCGIGGPVVFNVKQNIYTEQFRINQIAGTSKTNTITFQSETGNAADVILQYTPASVNNNYVVLLDSATHINFKNLTIRSLADANVGRMVVLANTAAEDSIVGCKFDGANVASIITYMDPVSSAGIYGINLKGGSLVIAGNIFRKASRGVYLQGLSATVLSRNNIIERNTFDSVYHQYIYAANASGIKVNKNTIPVNTALSAASFNQGVYAIYLSNCDSAYEVNDNNITLQNNAGYIYGIRIAGNNATEAVRGQVRNNTVIGLTGLKSLTHGVNLSDYSYTDVINNEVSIASTVAGTSNSVYAAALVTTNGRGVNVYNNSLLNTSAAAGIYNVALFVDHQYFSSGGFTNFNNNVFANAGGGPAIFYNYTPEHVKTDYNLLYSAGNVLVKKGPTGGAFNADYASIAAWRNAYYTEINSIVYKPAFTSNSNLQPLASDANSWALQGRGTQLSGNNVDKNGNARSVTLTGGVPDIGAYEFLPTVAPPALVATPAVPAPGITQVFSMGSDTVTRITWAADAAVPAAVTLKRYSGVLPEGLVATEKSLYYYISAEVTGGSTYKFNVQQHFINPWQNNLQVKSLIKLGKTNVAGEWGASSTSVIDSVSNIIKDSAQTFLGKHTGMTDGKMPEKPVYTTTLDSSNLGTRFWAPYGLSRDAILANGQQMKFVLAAQKTTEVTVSVMGTPYSRTYTVPAGGVVTTDEVPKSGVYDACLRVEGLSDRGILIESKEPISATANLVAGLDETKGLLLPAGSYGKSYITLGARQFSGYSNETMSTSWVNVIADHDNTVVEIVPGGNTKGGQKAGVPFRVTLNRGQVYQILGAFVTQHYTPDNLDQYSYECADLTGTSVTAVPNDKGDCYAIAVFAGSAGTGIQCQENFNGADSYLFQQSYPNQAWGKYYLTAPFATRNSKNEHLFNIFRVMVKDPSTVVKRNGVVMSGMKANYYEFVSRDPEYIEADKPVMVGQYMTYFTSCGNDEYVSPGSAENMIYLTPLGHGLKSTTFYRRTGAVNYITAIVPTGALGSLKIDGAATFDSTYAHPQKPGYSVVMKSWASANGVSVISCDTAFTANVHMPYNMGHCYNVGFRIPRVGIDTSGLKNTHNLSAVPDTYTCVNAPFKPKVYLSVPATTLVWEFSKTTGFNLTADVVQNNPVPVEKVEIGYTDYYVYVPDQDLKISSTGSYTIPVKAGYSEAASSCASQVSGEVKILVTAAPVVDFTTAYNGCLNTAAEFTSTVAASNGAVADRWKWSFGDNTTSAMQHASKKWDNAGTYQVLLEAITSDGCLNTAAKEIKVHALPVVEAEEDSLGACAGNQVIFKVKAPEPDVIYSWFDVPATGTAFATGASYIATVAGTRLYYIGASQNGCVTDDRVKVTAYIIPDVAAPLVTADVPGVYSLGFTWAAVPNATGYVVSTDGGLSWHVPSSGSTGTTHVVTGLQPRQTVTILVKGIGGCKENVSAAVSSTTLSDKVFVPNSFSPNGDGKNDVLMVYGSAIKELKFMVFTQWGQKVFETAVTGSGWDGLYNGKPLPSGVYVYVCSAILTTGQEINKKGSINLIR